MSMHYELSQDGYTLYDGDTMVLKPLARVAIAFDREEGVLYKHGDPKLVDEWADDFVVRLRKDDSPIAKKMVNSLVIVRGKFIVEELNKCLSISGYVGILYRSDTKKYFLTGSDRRKQ